MSLSISAINFGSVDLFHFVHRWASRTTEYKAGVSSLMYAAEAIPHLRREGDSLFKNGFMRCPRPQLRYGRPRRRARAQRSTTQQKRQHGLDFSLLVYKLIWYYIVNRAMFGKNFLNRRMVLCYNYTCKKIIRGGVITRRSRRIGGHCRRAEERSCETTALPVHTGALESSRCHWLRSRGHRQNRNARGRGS